MNSYTCNLCNNSKTKKFTENSVLCLECNSLFAISSVSNFPEITSNNTLKMKSQKKISKIVASSYFEYLKSKSKISFKNSLDIGAGFGDFVELLSKNGVDSYGIEYDDLTFKHSNSRIINKLFDTSFPEDKKYDLISINQSIYYFENTITILKKISSLLNKNGKILISTINPESKFRLENKIWTQGCNMCPSKKIYENLQNINLNLLDITGYDDQIYMKFFLHRKKEISTWNFWKNNLTFLTNLKDVITLNPNGINYFILLEKTE